MRERWDSRRSSVRHASTLQVTEGRVNVWHEHLGPPHGGYTVRLQAPIETEMPLRHEP